MLLGAAIASVALTCPGVVDGHAAWSKAAGLPGLSTGRIWSLASSPKTAGLVVAGTDHGVYLTSDGGVTWTQSGLAATRVWAVGFDVNNPAHVFAGSDGSGVFVSKDSGATWTSSSTGLTDRTVRSLAFGSDGIAAGTNKGVALSPDGAVWHDGGLDQYSIASLAIAANTPLSCWWPPPTAATSPAAISSVSARRGRAGSRCRAGSPRQPW